MRNLKHHIWGLVRDSNPGPLEPKARVYSSYHAATTLAVEGGSIPLRQGDENVDVSPGEEGHGPHWPAENQIKSWLHVQSKIQKK